MKRFALMVCVGLLLAAGPARADNPGYLFLCRSPLIAFDYWRALQGMKDQGVTLTPKIAEEVCNGMRTDQDQQCIRVEADAFQPVATGWGGALAMTDGKTKVWFHNPDAGGWVHPDYYVSYVNLNSR